MAKLTTLCAICGRTLELTSEVKVSETERLATYKCGHSFVEPLAVAPKLDELKFTSVSGDKVARDYQKDGIKFILDSGFNCVIGDQMRLGKTPQSLLALANAYSERTPCLILVRSANLWQWIREYKEWTDSLPLGIYPIIGSKGFIPPAFSAYIMSMDTFSKKGVVEKLLTFGFKLVIIDEAHSFKNAQSQRSTALIQFLQEISKSEIVMSIPFTCTNCAHAWTEEVKIQETARARVASKTAYCPQCNAYNHHTSHLEKIETKRKCGVIMLTGTAIKNRAEEYFVPLNIIAPDKFPSLASFRRNYLTQSESGKWNRIHPYRMDAFKNIIAPFVLRREKEDVYTDLPALNRLYTIIPMADDNLRKAYNATLDKIEENAARNNFKFFDNIGELMTLRRICGIAKVDWAVSYASDLLDESDTQRLAIGIHHHSVRDLLTFKLKPIGGALRLSGEDNAENKDRVMRAFETSAERVLVINTLAGGVGMDFHYVNNVLILERQWSSADEEQFEFRFYNPDKSIKTAATNVEYVLMKDTIDEFFHDLVSEKHKIFGETIGNNWSLQEDLTGFKALLERTIGGR
jgi:SNF2 family DNA or RNA helicase